MKSIGIMTILCSVSLLLSSCGGQKSESAEDFKYVVDEFADLQILRYRVPGWEDLSLQQKAYVYHLSEAAKCGRDIIFDQNFKYNLTVRRVLENIYLRHEGDSDSTEFRAMEKYLKKVWFANGIHHHYSNDKFRPEFSRKWFEEAVDKYVDVVELPVGKEQLCDIIFDPSLYATRLDQTDGNDLLATSACNYYEGVTMKEAEEFYAAQADHNDPQPVSYGLNSKLEKRSDGEIVERTW